MDHRELSWRRERLLGWKTPVVGHSLSLIAETPFRPEVWPL